PLEGGRRRGLAEEDVREVGGRTHLGYRRELADPPGRSGIAGPDSRALGANATHLREIQFARRLDADPEEKHRRVCVGARLRLRHEMVDEPARLRALEG